MAKCIVCGVEVNEKELKECEKEGTYGIYCGNCLYKLVDNFIQSDFQTSTNSN